MLQNRFVLVYFLLICDRGSTNDLQEIPPVHAMDEFSSCKARGDLFCRIQFSLRPNTYGDKTWKKIQEQNKRQDCFNRDVIYRFRCFPNHLEGNLKQIEENAIKNENELLQNFSLTADVDAINCSNYSEEMKFTNFDYMVLYSTLTWLAVITLGTVLHILCRMITTKEVSPHLKSISMLHNWENLRKPIENVDYQKLISIQGIRTINIAIVVAGHSVYNAIFAFVADTNVIEDFYRNGLKKYIMNMGLHIIQTNFLISGWLLANQLHSYLEKHKKLSVKFTIKMILYRYLRIIPALSFLILWQSSNWTRAARGPPLERSEMDFKACQKNWWATLSLVNNYLLPYDMCNLGTWYLANDFQMFAFAILLFYVMTNHNIADRIIIWTLEIFCIIHAVYIYVNNLGVIFDFTPENAKVENSVASPSLNILYMSFYGNYSAYAIGLIFGGLYHKYKNNQIKVTGNITQYWLLLFLGLSFGAVYVSMFQFSRLTSAIIGAALKPIFTLGVAIGIFGMSHGIGGIVKKICESRFLVFLSNWTYCTYIIHFPIVFSRYAMMNQPVEMSQEIMITSIISDVTKSFVAGLFLHLIVERPCINILKRLMRESPNMIKKE